MHMHRVCQENFSSVWWEGVGGSDGPGAGVLSSAACFVTYRRLPAYKKPNGGGSNLPPNNPPSIPLPPTAAPFRVLHGVITPAFRHPPSHLPTLGVLAKHQPAECKAAVAAAVAAADAVGMKAAQRRRER